MAVWAAAVSFPSVLATGSAVTRFAGTTTSPRTSAVFVAVPAALVLLWLRTLVTLPQWTPRHPITWDKAPWLVLQDQDPLLRRRAVSPRAVVMASSSNSAALLALMLFLLDWEVVLLRTPRLTRTSHRLPALTRPVLLTAELLRQLSSLLAMVPPRLGPATTSTLRMRVTPLRSSLLASEASLSADRTLARTEGLPRRASRRHKELACDHSAVY